MDADRFITKSLKDIRIARILAAAMDAVDPRTIVRQYLAGADLPTHERVYLLGIGKAAEPMVLAAADMLPDFVRGLVITKQTLSPARERIQVMGAGHPVPDARSVMAGRAALDFVSQLSEDDLLICLISGGGSALATSPLKGIGLRDMQLVTMALLAAGAGIEDINIIRRHLDGIKGGGLARATKARVLTLLLSDVIGDRIQTIASGPTAPDLTSGSDALTILNRYGIPAAPNVYALLSSQPAGGYLPDSRVVNIVIGNNELAARAARQQAEVEGFSAEILRTDIQGEASLVGEWLAERLRISSDGRARPFCLIVGGETTVTLRGDGKGGRNQELALAAAGPLAGIPNIMLIALATDGDDGPTDAAGAVVTGETLDRAHAAGLEAAEYLARNDSYTYFDVLGDLLRPGYSGTNVNDLIFLIAS